MVFLTGYVADNVVYKVIARIYDYCQLENTNLLGYGLLCHIDGEISHMSSGERSPFEFYRKRTAWPCNDDMIWQ